MIDGKHRVGFAAAERSLQLNDRIASAPGQAFDYGIEQQTHSFGDKCSLEKERRVLIFGCRRTVVNAGQVGGELGLLKSALKNIFVRNGDFAPRLERHIYTFIY
ncbi:MAG TPA: hypothetical protein VFQ83_11095 [Candidatus Udaeobacter sp.]|nr:hypothetical protein [Candidatus Udaeobacter sp.]